MAFNVYNTTDYVEDNTDYYESVFKKNRVPYKNIDLSGYKPTDVVGLLDGDWLAYSVCCTLTQWDSINVAKGRINKKIEAFIRESRCNEIIIFCGSTGNFRFDLLLPKRINTVADNSGKYKDNRRDQETPPFLEEIKNWLQKKYKSWWSVCMEADDSIVISSVYLTEKGIQSYIYGIDKDYNQIHGGGLALVGHQDTPTFFLDNEENRLGELNIIERLVTRENGTTYVAKDVKGHGDKFLVYQCLTEDAADNYSCKNFIKNNFSGGNFGDKVAVNYINQARTREELWTLYLDYLEDKLPPVFEYEAWNGTIVKATPFDIADLYFKCACMIRKEGVRPDLKSYLEEIV